MGFLPTRASYIPEFLPANAKKKKLKPCDYCGGLTHLLRCHNCGAPAQFKRDR
jgi:hypothetical protein